MNMLAELKHTAQDHEWYPTTNEIIEAFHNHVHHFEIESLLDLGDNTLTKLLGVTQPCTP